MSGQCMPPPPRWLSAARLAEPRHRPCSLLTPDATPSEDPQMTTHHCPVLSFTLPSCSRRLTHLLRPPRPSQCGLLCAADLTPRSYVRPLTHGGLEMCRGCGALRLEGG